MTDVTELRHYTHYPVCGFCTEAWDVIYVRSRSTTSPADWVGFCKHGGCDPEVWDFLDDDDGWPLHWEIGKNGRPVGYLKDRRGELFPAKFDNRVFHRRSGNEESAPWRKAEIRLLREAQEKKAKIKNLDVNDPLLWGSDDENTVEVLKGDLVDADIWD